MKPDTSFLNDFLDKDIDEMEELYLDKLKRKKQYEKTKRKGKIKSNDT